MAEKEVCSEKVFSRWWDPFCQHKVTTHENGKPWCTIHAPSYIARKQAEGLDAQQAAVEARETQEVRQKAQLALYPELVAVGQKTLEHLNELAGAWQSGALSECDGKGGTRSNRNMDITAEWYQLLVKAKELEEVKE